MIDYYEALQVHPLAEQEVIEKAYKALVMKYHPDAGGDSERMVAINQAYEVLSDPTRRSQYDRELLAARYRDDRSETHGVTAPTEEATGNTSDYDRAADWVGGAADTAKVGFRFADHILSRVGGRLGHVVEGGLAEAMGALGGGGLSEAKHKDWDAAYRTMSTRAAGWPFAIDANVIEEAATLQLRPVKAVSILNFPRGDAGRRNLAWLAVRHPDANARRRAKQRYEFQAESSLSAYCRKCERVVGLNAEVRCPAGHDEMAIAYAGTLAEVSKYAADRASRRG